MKFREYINMIAEKKDWADCRVIRYRLIGENYRDYKTALVIPTGIKEGKFCLDLVTNQEVNKDDIYVVYSWSVSNMVRTMINMCSYAEDFNGDI